ncbi:MAG: hypothetical protein Q7J57_00440 [Gemmobacter sp.]|nr:hypothetical protein [Gemmobacter sp.]
MIRAGTVADRGDDHVASPGQLMCLVRVKSQSLGQLRPPLQTRQTALNGQIAFENGRVRQIKVSAGMGGKVRLRRSHWPQKAKIGGFSGRRILLTGQPGVAADLSYHLDFGLGAVTATAFFMLGAAAMVFCTSFFGFFSSRRRFVMPLAMVLLL